MELRLVFGAGGTSRFGPDGHTPTLRLSAAHQPRTFSSASIKFLFPLMIGQEVIRTSRIVAIDNRVADQGISFLLVWV